MEPMDRPDPVTCSRCKKGKPFKFGFCTECVYLDRDEVIVEVCDTFNEGKPPEKRISASAVSLNRAWGQILQLAWHMGRESIDASPPS